MFKYTFLTAATALSLALSSLSVQAIQSPFADSLQKNKFPPVEQVFQLDYSQVDSELLVRFDISDGFYLYQHRLNFTPEEKINRLHPLPEGERFTDEFFGDTVIYRDSLELVMDLNAATRNEVLNVQFQGCADDGFCYPPSTQQIFLRRTNGANASVNADENGVTVNITDNKTAPWLPIAGIFLVVAVFLLVRRARKRQ